MTAVDGTAAHNPWAERYAVHPAFVARPIAGHADDTPLASFVRTNRTICGISDHQAMPVATITNRFATPPRWHIFPGMGYRLSSGPDTLSPMPKNPIDRWRRRVVANTTGLFAHADDPLANTLDHRGDPGLFGPGSVTWEVMGDPATFVGGIRALMIQAAHPEVVAGVKDHSSYRTDPLGRLSRTSNYVTATSYGAMPEVEAAVAEVRRAHRPVKGRSHRDVAYTAGTPRFAAWVHNSLTDSFLAANQAYGRRRLLEAEADQFVREQAEIGRLLDADPLPQTAQDLADWVANHPDVGPSPGMEDAMAFLQDPPLDFAIKAGYVVLAKAAVAIIPERVRSVLDVKVSPGSEALGRASAGFLRWALGSSPRWRISLIRVGAEVPEHLFKQKLPFEEAIGSA